MSDTTRRAAVLVALAAAALALPACSSSIKGSGSGGQSQHRGGSSASTGGQSQPAVGPSASAPASVPTSSAPASLQGLPDACRLLSQAEAEAMAGAKLGPGSDTPARDPATDDASCTYNSPPTGTSASVSVFVQVARPHALDVDKSLNHKFRTVPGIGDQTLEEPENASIFIHKGQLWVFLNSSFGATPKAMEIAAAKVAARLP